MTNRKNNTDKSDKRIYDLEERTARFGENIIEFSKKIPQNPVTISLINQLVRAATSVGANYCEADNEFPRRISTIELIFVERNQKRLNIG